MLDYETRTQKRVEEATSEGMLKAAKNYIENVHKEHPEADYTLIVKKAITVLGLDEELASKLRKAYTK